jgi:hypothetical protein
MAFDAQRNGRAGGRVGVQVGRWAGEGLYMAGEGLNVDRDVTAPTCESANARAATMTEEIKLGIYLFIKAYH